ncbi:hypothetical protein Tco_0759449 [Tanacetum coccineum]
MPHVSKDRSSKSRKRRQQQVRQTSVESPNLEKPNPPIVTMEDNRTMAQLLEAPTEGYEDAIVVPEINANNFEIKHVTGLNLVQNKQFFGQTRIKKEPTCSHPIFQQDHFYDEVPERPDKPLFPLRRSGSPSKQTTNTIAITRKVIVKAIHYITRSGVFPIMTSNLHPPKEKENEPEVTKDTVQPSTENIQPLVVQTNDQIGEPVVASKTKPTLPYPSRANKEKLREKDNLLASKL